MVFNFKVFIICKSLPYKPFKILTKTRGQEQRNSTWFCSFALYWQKRSCRLTLWMKKTNSANVTPAKPPVLRSLLLTNKPLQLNITWVHQQGAYWEDSVTEEPYKLDPSKLGWEEDPQKTLLLRPVMICQRDSQQPLKKYCGSQNLTVPLYLH